MSPAAMSNGLPSPKNCADSFDFIPSSGDVKWLETVIFFLVEISTGLD
jgi:hypothetical protein